MRGSDNNFVLQKTIMLMLIMTLITTQQKLLVLKQFKFVINRSFYCLILTWRLCAIMTTRCESSLNLDGFEYTEITLYWREQHVVQWLTPTEFTSLSLSSIVVLLTLLVSIILLWKSPILHRYKADDKSLWMPLLRWKQWKNAIILVTKVEYQPSKIM